MKIPAVLINIKGIGPWTIDMLLIFGLGHLDILPVGDLGLIKAISISYKVVEFCFEEKELPDEFAYK